MNGVDLRGRAEDPDPRVALDAVLEKQEQALRRRKDRLIDRKRRGKPRGGDMPPAPAVAPKPDEDGRLGVLRTRAPRRTMTVEQAVRTLLKGRQPILAFSEADGGGLCVAYRLENGQVGLLELD